MHSRSRPPHRMKIGFQPHALSAKVSNRARNVFHLTPVVPWQVEQPTGQTLKELKVNHLDHVVAPRGLWPFPCNVVVQMIRITQVEEGKKHLLRVEGWLQSEEVAELRRVTEAAGSEVALDLSELRMTDKAGHRGPPVSGQSRSRATACVAFDRASSR